MTFYIFFDESPTYQLSGQSIILTNINEQIKRINARVQSIPIVKLYR